MVLITAMFSGGLTLLYVKRSMDVARLQKANKLPLGPRGTEDSEDLDQALSELTHFSEYVPLGLLLLGALELNSAPPVLVIALGVLLFVGRYWYARGPERRIQATKWTLVTLALLALSNMGWTAYQLIESVRFSGNVYVH